jgi:Glycosyltransferase
MNIMVFDVPAESGGALSVLCDFYKEVSSNRDKSINWIFVISKPELRDTENIKVLRFPWIKRSWGHRICFDNIVAPQLVRRYRPGKIVSLQNVIIPHVNAYQILYVHNSLPFSDYKFTLKENKLLWVYQNIISKNIMMSIKKSNSIIVQTKWMKKACVDNLSVKEKKIQVVPPQIKVDIKNFFEPNAISLSTFFFPASGIVFKNHKTIVKASKRLREKGIGNFKVVFTLSGNENNHILDLYNEVIEKKLPIEFVGGLSREQVFSYYSKSVLLFPSLIESSPLPLTEAKLYHSIILAADFPFSHEILDGYKNAYFFNALSDFELAELMEKVMHQKVEYFKCTREIEKLIDNKSKLIDYVINL